MTPFTNDNDNEKVLLQYAVWSPIDSAIAFVYQNDIYFKKHVSDHYCYRITSTGSLDTIYNGIPDWLYENEIHQTDHAMWFSHDGSFLLYLTFNDTLVQKYVFSVFAQNKYPKTKSIRFPKVSLDLKN